MHFVRHLGSACGALLLAILGGCTVMVQPPAAVQPRVIVANPAPVIPEEYAYINGQPVEVDIIPGVAVMPRYFAECDPPVGCFYYVTPGGIWYNNFGVVVVGPPVGWVWRMPPREFLHRWGQNHRHQVWNPHAAHYPGHVSTPGRPEPGRVPQQPQRLPQAAVQPVPHAPPVTQPQHNVPPPVVQQQRPQPQRQAPQQQKAKCDPAHDKCK